MNNFIYIILIFTSFTYFHSIIPIDKQKVDNVEEYFTKEESTSTYIVDEQIEASNEAMTNKSNITAVFSITAFLQNIGIEILLKYLAIRRGIGYCIGTIKEVIWKLMPVFPE